MAAVSATPVFASATAVQTTVSYTATTVTFKIPFSGATPAWVRVFIDSDRVATSGFKTSSIGANFMVENGNLYRYSGSNGAWGWTFVKLVSNTSANSLATVVVNRADIGASATSAAINVVTQTDAPGRVANPRCRSRHLRQPRRQPRRRRRRRPRRQPRPQRRRRPQHQRRRRPQRQLRRPAPPCRSATAPAAPPSPIPSAVSTAMSAAKPRSACRN